LLNQIREQANQIRDLMAQLEALSSKRTSSNASDSFTSSPGLNSPVLSPTSSHGYVGSEISLTGDAERNKAVEDWIAKAKQSFQEFDGYIGGAGLPKSYFVEKDPENPDTSDEDNYNDGMDSDDGDDGYAIAIEHFDGDEMFKNSNYLRHRSSESSFGSGTTGHHRRRKSSGSLIPVELPGGAAPFGLFGVLALKTAKKRGSSAEVEEDDKAAGIANTNFFRSSKFLIRCFESSRLTVKHSTGSRVD
jgi:hypothetical protein